MSDSGDMGGNGGDDMGGSACGDMDSGNSVQGAETAVGGETTAGFEDNKETEQPDSAYSTLVNTPASSTETIYNDCDSAMDVDDAMDVASNMGQLRCGGCGIDYDSQTHVVSVGECGHEQCSSCWAQSNLCSYCNIYSQNTKPTLPRSGRDMMSAEPIDEPREAKAISMSKGVLLKSSTHNNNLGVLKPLTGVKLEPCQPSAQASSAIAGVKIKCMDGRSLDEKINPSTTTVGGLKRTINQKMGISSERQHLLHQGKTMTDARTLHSYNVTNGSTIQMAERCSGG